MIPKITVLCNPHATQELAPSVAFAPRKGFNVQHGNIKGAWLPEALDAVGDFNGKVERALNRLRLVSFTPETFNLSDCFGAASAFEAMQKATAKPAPEEPGKRDCACPVCKLRNHAPGGLLGLVAMLAALGVIDGAEDEEPEGKPFLLDTLPEMADLLASRGLLHRTGPNSAVVAIPRKWGEAVVAKIEAAVRAGDLERVNALTLGRTV